MALLGAFWLPSRHSLGPGLFRLARRAAQTWGVRWDPNSQADRTSAKGPVRRPDRDSPERTVLLSGAATAGVRNRPVGRPRSLPPGTSCWTHTTPSSPGGPSRPAAAGEGA